jgi:hypothetical protein
VCKDVAVGVELVTSIANRLETASPGPQSAGQLFAQREGRRPFAAAHFALGSRYRVGQFDQGVYVHSGNGEDQDVVIELAEVSDENLAHLFAQAGGYAHGRAAFAQRDAI